MALQLPNSIFIHIPRTGGMWVTKALQVAGIPINSVVANKVSEKSSEWALRHSIVHSPLSNVHCQGRKTFSFVRHPCSWFQSYWCFQMRSQWRHLKKGDSFYECQADQFEEFALRVVQYQPGFVSRMYKTYLFDEKRAVDFVGRQEQLVDELICVLRSNNEEFNEKALRRVASLNEASALDDWKQRCIFHSKEIFDRIVAVEAKGIELFGYSKDAIAVEDIAQKSVMLAV
jgi:hypothetical protein